MASHGKWKGKSAMATNGDVTAIGMEEFMQLLVQRRRLQRYYDFGAGLCTLVDIDNHQKFCIDISSLQILFMR